MSKYGIGQPVSRFEDPRLLRGRGRYQDDLTLPGQAYAVFLRSPHAHARIRAVDTAAAVAMPGVLAVYSGADVVADGLGTMAMRLQRKRPDGLPMFARPHPGLARDRVRYVGDPVAMVVAESVAQAKDAAECVVVDYEPLPSVTDTAAAAKPGAPPVWDECPDNVSNLFEAGDKADADAAFARARHIFRRRYVISRVFAHYMEP
jgi:aerobic carbon-monoxide dehydrogenase large subunit